MPRLPEKIKRLDMRIRYRGHSLDLRFTRDTLTVHRRERGAAPIRPALRTLVILLLVATSISAGLWLYQGESALPYYDSARPSARSVRGSTEPLARPARDSGASGATLASGIQMATGSLAGKVMARAASSAPSMRSTMLTPPRPQLAARVCLPRPLVARSGRRG